MCALQGFGLDPLFVGADFELWNLLSCERPFR
jgi:hypothetical protein